MVAAMVLFGDPYFNRQAKKVDRGSYSGRRGGILGERPLFDHKAFILSYCHSHDPICKASASESVRRRFSIRAHSRSVSTRTTPLMENCRQPPKSPCDCCSVSTAAQTQCGYMEGNGRSTRSCE